MSMPKMIKNKKKAFSLLEVVIALFVFSLLVPMSMSDF